MAAKVLIVEDDPNIVKVYSTQLVNDGYEILTAETAADGLKAAKENNPNLILLDIMLAGDLNGFDLLERIKSDKKLDHIKILVLTNLSSEEKVAKEIGASDYLVKVDTTPKELSKRVKEILSS